MFDKRTDLVRFLTAVEVGGIAKAADRLAMTQPALTRVIARLEQRLGGRLFERLPSGVRLTVFGTTVADLARRILREIELAEQEVDAARSGRTGRIRVTASPVWIEAVLPVAIVRFQEEFPGIGVGLEAASRAEGVRRLIGGETDLHCGGIDAGEVLPTILRGESFLEEAAGIVARESHPLHAGKVSLEGLAGFPWIDFDAHASVVPCNGRTSLSAVLDGIHRKTQVRVTNVIRTGTAGLSLMASGPYLSWLPLTFLERLPELRLRHLPVEFARTRYRSGFVARRAAEDLAPFRRFQAILRETAIGARG